MTASTAGRKRTTKAPPNPTPRTSAGELNAEQAIKLVMEHASVTDKEVEREELEEQANDADA